MNTIKSIWVCCAASDLVCTEIKDRTRELGVFLARHNIKVIHGGGSTGLMRAVSDGVKSAKGEELGIMTHQVAKLELPNPCYAHQTVDTFFERKRLLMAASDAYLFTEGGVGTLDELFEALVLNKVGVENKPIIIYDPTVDRRWSALIKHIIAECQAMKTLGAVNIIYAYCTSDLRKVLK